MASVEYKDIFGMFLGNITDYKLASLEEEDATALMTEYLHKALYAPYVRRIFKSVSFVDAEQVIEFTMNHSTTEDNDKGFVTTAIAKWMTYEWVHNQVNNVVNTAQFFGGAEQKYYSQQQHLTALRELQDSLYKEARNFVMDRGYITNSYLGGS